MSGGITLSAGNQLTALLGGDISGDSGAVTLTADADGVGGGSLTLADGTVLNAGAGAITLLATGDITLGRLLTTNGTGEAVLVRSTAGRILDGGDTGGPDITAETAGAVTTLQAAAGIGSSANALDLAVQQLVTVTSNSGQYLAERDDLASLDLQAGTGRITLTAGGAVAGRA